MAPHSRLSASIFNCGLLFALSLSIAFKPVAGQSVGIDDLPTCAVPCALTAATAVGCKLADAACLCSHPMFTTATVQCAQISCMLEDRGAVSGVLSQMCATLPGPSSSSSPASTSASSSGSQPSHTSSSPSSTSDTTHATPSSSTSSSSSSPTITSPTGTSSGPGISSGNSLTPSESSTVVVVQTVVLPQTSAPSSAARTAGFGNMGAVLAFLVAGWLFGVQVALL